MAALTHAISCPLCSPPSAGSNNPSQAQAGDGAFPSPGTQFPPPALVCLSFSPLDGHVMDCERLSTCEDEY